MITKCYSSISLFGVILSCFFNLTIQDTANIGFSNREGESTTSPYGIIQASSTQEDCYCGEHSSGCSFIMGKKMCQCYKGYKQTTDSPYGKCEECDCGSNSLSCHFNNSQKICTCPKGYSGASGQCLECDCGINSISCERLAYTIKKCVCKKGYVSKTSFKNPLEQECKICDCGPNSLSCKYQLGGMKECKCKPGSTVIPGGLFDGDKGCSKVCDCGENAISCSLNSYGDKKCYCKPGYVSSSLGLSGEVCKKCDCGPYSTYCSLSFNGKRLCTCRSGYISKSSSTFNRDEECVPNALTKKFNSPWKIATYVTISVFAVIVLSLMYSVRQERCNRWCTV